MLKLLRPLWHRFTVIRAVRSNREMSDWAPTLAGLPIERLWETDEEGWTYVSPRPDFIEFDDREGMAEYRRRYAWATANGLIEERESEYGEQTRINDTNWWYRAGEAVHQQAEVSA